MLIANSEKKYIKNVSQQKDQKKQKGRITNDSSDAIGNGEKKYRKNVSHRKDGKTKISCYKCTYEKINKIYRETKHDRLNRGKKNIAYKQKKDLTPPTQIGV